MNAICLVVDRLQAGCLGAFGNSWIETPSFDRLASQSMVFDQMLIDTPRLETLCRSYWQGLHAFCPAANRPTLAALLREAGVESGLLTDARSIQELPLAGDFDEIVQIDPPLRMQMAGEGRFHQTHLARCFVQIIDWLQAAPRPFLLWCHLASLGEIWDAPPEFRQRYWEEGDPPPSRSADPPEAHLGKNPDPDEILVATQAYAGQVSLFDACLGGLLEFLQDSPAGEETLLAITSPRGFPLGEHGRIGPCDDALYGELVHVPLMLRFPSGEGAAHRSQALVEPSDLWATLLNWWGLGQQAQSPSALSLMPLIDEQFPWPRDRLCILGDGLQQAIRTPAWYLRAGSEMELFAKPDDFWEVNNVAQRCQVVVECLGDAMAQFQQTIQAGHVADLPALSEALIRGLD